MAWRTDGRLTAAQQQRLLGVEGEGIVTKHRLTFDLCFLIGSSQQSNLGLDPFLIVEQTWRGRVVCLMLPSKHPGKLGP